MQIRRFAQLSAFVALLSAPALASANTLTLTDYGTTGAFGTNAPGGGGPFLATATDTTLGDAGSLITFCLEFNEHFSYGGTYLYEESPAAISGGVSGGNPDPVDNATKWLYGQVVSGGWSSAFINGSNNWATANVGARVQEAIWYIEGERQQSEISGDSFGLATYAINNFSSWTAPAGYSFFALNLTDASGGRYQDQLGWRYRVTGQDVPVPEPASLVLLGTGLLFASRARLRRRR